MAQVSTYQLFTSRSFLLTLEQDLRVGWLLEYFFCARFSVLFFLVLEDYPFFKLDVLHLNVDDRNNNVIVNKSNLVILNISTNQ